MTPRPDGYFTATMADVRADSGTGCGSLRDFVPIRCRVFSRMGRSDPRWSWIRRTFPWTVPGWAGAQPRHRQVVYELHIGTFTTGGTWASARERLPHLASARRDDARGDADRRVRRPIRLGLRRRVSLCALPSVRHARRCSRLRRCRARCRPRGDSRRRLQPPRTVGKRAATSSARRYFADHDTEWGRGFNLDGDCSGTRPALHARERAPLAGGVPLRRPSLRCHPRDRRSIADPHRVRS